MVVLANGSQLLIMGGLNAAGESTTGVLAADPASGLVLADGALAVAVHDAGGALLGGAAYIFGGGTAASISTVQAISPGNSARVVGNLPTPRSDLVAAVAGSEALVVGGYDGSSATNAVLATRDGTQFRVVASLQQRVRYPAVAVVGAYLFVFGGEWAGQDTAAIQRVDLRNGAVDVVGQLPVGLAHCSALVLNGRVWLAGGISAGHATDAVYLYDTHSQVVTRAGTLPRPVSDAGLALLGSVGYLVGGEIAGSPTKMVIELRLPG